MKAILEIHDISKKYQINGHQRPYLSLRDNLFSVFSSREVKEEFWALRNLSFEVMPGDTLGIVGKNGAGKSTLLKILSKITPPTTGKIIGRGRIASLLEVGTGFHSELSGRENVYMNGSILGMRRMEITKNFDKIVEFAGVHKFIDTPLKHYSSGMQLRLAFAVAAFLENEILIIDEVLAVGDSEFQKKCLGKMKDITGQGRTILFVSHNISAIQSLCSSSMLLESGMLKHKGETAEIIAKYTKDHSFDNHWQFQFKPVTEIAYATRVEIYNHRNIGSNKLIIGQPWQVVITFELLQPVENLVICLGLVNNFEIPIRNSWNKTTKLSPGTYRATFKESTVKLAVGGYRFIIGISIGKHSVQYIDRQINFEVIESEQNNEQEFLYDIGNAVFVNQMEMSVEKQDF